MQIYNVIVELSDGSDVRLQVQTELSLAGGDEDMLLSEIETCLEEQHGITDEMREGWYYV